MQQMEKLAASTARIARISALAAVVVFGGAAPALAGTVSGIVTNGTTNRPVAGAEVILLQLQGGMQPVATTKTDAAGHFTIVNDALGSAPMLLRVPYQGVLYHQPVPPNTPTVNVEVYNATRDPHSFAVTTRAIILQPKGANLVVGEEYSIENQTNPPVAYYVQNGTFDFHVPKGAQLDQVSAWDASGMPVIQGTMDKPNGMEAVDWPFRPGNNGVRYSYELPYTGNQASFTAPAPYSVQQMLLAVPPGLQVSSPGFTAAGNEQGFDIYTRGAVAANTPITVTVSGVASAPVSSSPGDNSQNPSVNSRADDAAANVTTLPPRLSNRAEYILISGFAALFILGVLFLWRRPAGQAAAGSGGNADVSALPIASAPSPADAPVAAPGVSVRHKEKPDAVSAQAAREAAQSLDALKEKLFRLELRHQAGTISDQEYAREREATQKILRDLLKG